MSEPCSIVNGPEALVKSGHFSKTIATSASTFCMYATFVFTGSATVGSAGECGAASTVMANVATLDVSSKPSSVSKLGRLLFGSSLEAGFTLEAGLSLEAGFLLGLAGGVSSAMIESKSSCLSQKIHA